MERGDPCLGAQTVPVPQLVIYNPFFLVGEVPGQFYAGVGHAAKLELGWLTWN